MNQDEDVSDNDDVNNNDETRVDEKHHLLYDQEQQELRSAFLESTQDDTENNDEQVLILKKRGEKIQDNETEMLIQQELEALEKTSSHATMQDPRGEIQDGDKFLLEYIKNKKWIDKDDDDDDDDSSSEEEKSTMEADDSRNHDNDDDSIAELERADDFESQYNFRFEQAQAEAGTSGATHSVVGYARSGMMNTMRRPDESRKQKRQERRERKAAERRAKEEQLRRLKNAKREEMEVKLKQIKSVLGNVEGRGMAVDEATMMKLMDGEYDSEQFEQIMNEAYGDDFYQQDDAEWKTDQDVRSSILKDEDGDLIAGLDDEAGGLYDNVEEDEEYGGDDTQGETAEQDQDWNENQEYYGEEEEVDTEAFGAHDEEETETERKLREKMKDELYKLDYEDIVAGMPTRFKYRSVPKNNYGLSTEEILFAKDTTLKNFVSLKKMAPYREDVRQYWLSCLLMLQLYVYCFSLFINHSYLYLLKGEYHVNSKKRRRFREQLKEDLEEAMAGEEGDQSNREDIEEQGDAEAPKKKRRRQKKGKKKSKEDGDKDDDRKPAAAVVSDQTNEDDAKSKRKRKKKGRKAQKQDGAMEAIDAAEAKAVGTVASIEVVEDSKPPAVQMEENSGAIDSKKAKKKKHKKKKKSKTVAVEGVSASRLASYNL